VIKSKKPSKSTPTLLIKTLLSAHDSSWNNIHQLLKNLVMSELDPFLHDELTTVIDHATTIMLQYVCRFHRRAVQRLIQQSLNG